MITAPGKRVLREAKEFKMALWNQYPALSGKLNFAL
jgi:hypothetical protein